MNLKFQKLGPIKKGSVRLDNDLIILCGPNNTGKTYLAYTIFGLSKDFKKQIGVDYKKSFKLRKSIFERLLEFGIVEVDLIEVFIQSYEEILLARAENLKKNLTDIFNVPVRSSLFGSVMIDLQIKNKEINTYLNSLIEKVLLTRYYIGKYTLVFEKHEIGKDVKITLIREDSDSNEELKNDVMEIVELYLSYTLDDIILNSLFNNVYIAPAERASINLFSTELFTKRGSLLDEINKLSDQRKTIPIEIIQNRSRRYSLPIMESLRLSSDLKELSKKTSNFSYLADYLENEILEGKINLSDSGEILFTTRNSDVQLDLHLSASIVKSLASIVFYFRHLAKSKDFVIIDEPELNLHPDNQRKIAKFIAKIVNAGFKVLISTHSDYLIREFNNLIMLNNESPRVDKLLKEFGYDRDETLDYKKIGVHLLKSDGTVENVEIDPTGFSVSTIVEQISKQSEASDKIYYTLYDND